MSTSVRNKFATLGVIAGTLVVGVSTNSPYVSLGSEAAANESHDGRIGNPATRAEGPTLASTGNNEVEALIQKGCTTGPMKAWCSTTSHPGGCWNCSFDSYDECKKYLQSNSDDICAPKSDAK